MQNEAVNWIHIFDVVGDDDQRKNLVKLKADSDQLVFFIEGGTLNAHQG